MAKQKYTITINGKEQNGNGAAVLAAIIASPFASETAAIISAVQKNEKFTDELKKAQSVVYEDDTKVVKTTGRAIVDYLPRMAEYHWQATELSALRKELSSFRKVEWKKKRGRHSSAPAEIEIDLDL